MILRLRYCDFGDTKLKSNIIFIILLNQQLSPKSVKEAQRGHDKPLEIKLDLVI